MVDAGHWKDGSGPETGKPTIRQVASMTMNTRAATMAMMRQVALNPCPPSAWAFAIPRPLYPARMDSRESGNDG